jgi:hypothetical protein
MGPTFRLVVAVAVLAALSGSVQGQVPVLRISNSGRKVFGQFFVITDLLTKIYCKKYGQNRIQLLRSKLLDPKSAENNILHLGILTCRIQKKRVRCTAKPPTVWGILSFREEGRPD